MYSGKETKVKSRMGKQMAVKKWHLRGAEARRTARADQRVFTVDVAAQRGGAWDR